MANYNYEANISRVCYHLDAVEMLQTLLKYYSQAKLERRVGLATGSIRRYLKGERHLKNKSIYEAILSEYYAKYWGRKIKNINGMGPKRSHGSVSLRKALSNNKDTKKRHVSCVSYAPDTGAPAS